jgi:hypothetical protein
MILVAVCFAALAGSATAASARPVFGVQGLSVGDSAAKTRNNLDAIVASGSTTVRIGVSWAELSPQADGVYDPTYLAALDQLMSATAARKLKVILFAIATPCWASSAPSALKAGCTAAETPESVYRYPPSDPATFARLSAFLVGRYQADLSAYEIWNEPDQVNQDYWAGPDKVRRYVALVKATYGPAKAAAPKVPVLAGSFVGGNGAWLQAMYDAGIKGYYDGLAVHFYDLPLYSLTTTRAVQLRNGDKTPEWLTEFGWDSCYSKGGPAVRVQHPCRTAATQGAALRDLLRAVHTTSWIKAAILYQLRDENADYRFGLFDIHGHVKPMYTALRQLLHGKLAGTLPRPVLHLRRRGKHLVVTGKVSITDVYSLVVKQGKTLRYRSYVRSDRAGGLNVSLPAGLPTSGVRVTLTSNWSHQSASAAR